MQPYSTCTKHQASESSFAVPRFWRTQFSDLVRRYGERETRRILETMERAYAPRRVGRATKMWPLPVVGFPVRDKSH